MGWDTMEKERAEDKNMAENEDRGSKTMKAEAKRAEMIQKHEGKETKERETILPPSSHAMRQEQTGAGEGKKETLRMEMESLSENEEFARVAVAMFMSRMNPTMEEIDDVKTAVSEAVTNGVIHGYQGKEGTLYIEVTITGRELTVTVADRGVGIADVKKAMEPMYTTDRTGERSGMGFSFMEAFMDDVQVISAPGEGTRVTMKKQIGR